jgi:hypothetical protein
MKNLSQHVGKLEVLTRLASSYSGNPRFLVRVAGITCKTAPDAMLGYGVQNYDGREVMAIIGTHYGQATLAEVKELNQSI